MNSAVFRVFSTFYGGRRGTVSMEALMRIILMTAACAIVASCGGGSAPSAPTGLEIVTTPVTTTSAPLPLGSAGGGNASCPTGSSAGARCMRLSVTCPSIPALGATLRITAPSSTNRGTILLSTGGGGTTLNGSIGLSAAMIQTFVADGLSVVELGWDQPGLWGGPQARTLACRYATAARWAYDNVHAGGRSTLFAAQGTSGGSSQIAFALAHYGLGDVIALANLGGGPPGCPLCSSDGVHSPEPLLPGSPPSLSRDPQVSYAGTTVRVFLAASEPTPDIVTDATAYYSAITTGKSMTMVPGTAHNIEETQAGVDAYVQSVRGAL